MLTEDHEALKRRVARLESLFDAASSRPESQEQREVDPETDDATEDAALVLKRMGSGLDQEGVRPSFSVLRQGIVTDSHIK